MADEHPVDAAVRQQVERVRDARRHFEAAAPEFAGFRRSVGGLLLPEAVSREVQTWTRDERKLLDRVAKMLTARKLTMLLGCSVHPECMQRPLEKIPQADGFILRCAHADRIVQSTF